MGMFAAVLSDFHDGFSFFVVIGNALAGLWALTAHWAESLRRRALWWFIIMVQSFVAIQVILGVSLVAGEGREVDGFHMFYGFIALATVGIIYSYRSQLAAKKYLLYGLGGFFLMGLGIRAMLIGGDG